MTTPLTAAAAGAAVAPVHLSAPTAAQVAIIRRTLGASYVAGEDGGMPPELLAAEVDLDGDGRPDLVASQRSNCTNHTCEDVVLLHARTGWRRVVTLQNWGDLYIVPAAPGAMRRLVYFDHRSDDCMACSPPSAVWVGWRPKPGGGDYVIGKVLTPSERGLLDEDRR